jgi:hypothetical protein
MSWPDTVRILQGFTSDPTLLSAAVNSLDNDAKDGAGPYEQWCTQQDARDRMTLEVLNQIAADASRVKGRKNLIWFTVGSPSITDPSSRLPCQRDYSRDLAKTYALLTTAQVAVYPVGANGVMTYPSEMQALPPKPYLAAVLAFNTGVAERHLSMESVAEATGGKAYYSSNDLEAEIIKAVADGSDYYTLSYVPPGTKYDGRHHTIKVQVDRPDLHLTYRDEYYAEDPSAQAVPPELTLTMVAPDAVDGNMRAAMSRSMPISTQLLFDVQVEPSSAPAQPASPTILGTLDAKLKGKPLTRYVFDYSIPARQIAFTNGPNGTHNGLLELDIAVYDANAKLVTGLSQTVKMPLSEDRYKQFIAGPFRFTQQIDLPPGLLFVRVGVLDRTSNKVGTLELPLTVAKK